MGNPTENGWSYTASFSPGHSRLQGTSNHYAVIIQKYPPRQDPKLRPAGQIQPKVGFLFPDSNEELPHVTVTKNHQRQ